MSVKQYQQILKDAGFYKGKIDGIRGPQTIAATKAYQKSKGLVADGVVGPKTKAAMGGGGGTTAAANGADSADLAQQYGFSMALLNTDPELKNLFNQAVSGTWTTDRFTAALRNTNWYKNNGESYRQALVLKTSDPATYNQGVTGSKARVQQFAASLGASLSGSTLDQLAETAYQFGWDDNLLRQHLSGYVQWTDGRMIGQAGVYTTQVKDYARKMGVAASDSFIETQMKAVMGGTKTIDDVLAMLRETAISAYPQLADRLRAGETVDDVASPYKQSMSSLLELDADGIELGDKLVKGALQQRDDKGGFQLQSLAQFEDTVRKDARWKHTKNANEAAAGMTNDLLRSFGLIS